ncbi:MAG: hypothetical protein Hals2KO_12730 [Halioglobus sp.]
MILIVIVVAVASLAVAFRFFNPTPPRSLTMTTGPEGSAYDRVAQQYREILAQSGVEVILQASDGAVENLRRVSSGESDVGFVTMGTPDASTAQNLRSLGALFYEPYWLFTTDPLLAHGGLKGIETSRFSIGPPGSRSNHASRYLFMLQGLNAQKMNLLQLDPLEAAKRLEQGELDTLAVVSAFNLPAIRQLLVMDNVTLVNFDRANAYTALYPELTKLIVPAGVGSLARELPAKDTQILAFTAIMAVRENLHPITQSLLMDAASHIHIGHDLFNEGGEFPMAVQQVIPLSDSAQAYYADGQPFILRFLPYWMAVLVMQAMVAAIPLAGVVYPLIRMMQSAFRWLIQRQFYQVYVELRQIDRSLGNVTAEELAAFRDRLEYLESRVTRLRAPVTYATTIFALKSHLSTVLQRVRSALEQHAPAKDK